MSLFDFFKKSENKKSTKSAPSDSSEGLGKRSQSATDNPFSSPEQNKKRYEAAMDFLQFFQEKTPLLNGRPHAGTVLSVGARLAGTSLFRSINKKDFPPDVVVLSDEANEAYPQLLNLFAYYCQQNGIDIMTKPVVTEFPEKDKPLMELSQVQAEYQQEYNLIMKKHGLDYLESARAGMIVCSILFNYHCINHKDIDPYVATGIVAMGVVEGAKTSPVSLEGKVKIGTKEMSRLVLGEPDVVREEALATGAIYIELNPGVLKILQQGNVDPYVIYEQGVLKQIEERIARIDFVKVNVDELFDEWRSKPLEQAPIHVRLIFWLKDNAASYGYEQSGNSWTLK
ncbi:MAG: hypothetical protein JW963_22905 [Anaerolineales bacterium]|nr:hypothetical protein [Anaerolineales bacterium]